MKNKISHKLIALGSITIAIVGLFSFLVAVLLVSR